MASLKDAIRAKCKDCCYDPLDSGTYLQQIENCTVKKCGLWHVRPMTVATVNLIRKNKAELSANLDALIAGLPDEDEDEDADSVENAEAV